MLDIMINIICILIFPIFFLLLKVREYYRGKSTFETVKWCVYYDSLHRERPEVRMRNHIFCLQRELSLDEKYRITQDDLDAMNEILLNFRQDLIQSYFSGYCIYNSADRAKNFVLNLNDFLEKHQDDYEIRNNITFHKLNYISQLYYLKLNNIVDADKVGVIMAASVKEKIDSLCE